jgi:hypothetical protein
MLVGIGGCGRGQRWRLESDDAFDNIVENVETTTEPKGDPRSEEDLSGIHPVYS